MRFRLGFHLGLLIRALLAANAGKRLPQIGFDAVGVTERTVKYRFHASLSSLETALHPARWTYRCKMLAAWKTCLGIKQLHV
jgi:hypothetical protein